MNSPTEFTHPAEVLVARPLGTLNMVERVLMNNPVRAVVQRQIEARQLLRMGGPVPGGRVLEVGCGRGVGIDILLRRFGAARVDAFDLDSDMVRLALRRHRRHGAAVRIWVGDVTAIRAPDAHYDAVFDFGILHHVPDWHAGLREIARVLRPGGRLFAEEILRPFLDHRLSQRLLDHPTTNRFDGDELASALETAQLALLERREWLGEVGWYVAQKPAESRAIA